jgi:hypothetical protein
MQRVGCAVRTGADHGLAAIFYIWGSGTQGARQRTAPGLPRSGGFQLNSLKAVANSGRFAPQVF